MLAVLGLGLVALAPSFQAEATPPGSRPGRIVLAAESLRKTGASEGSSPRSVLVRVDAGGASAAGDTSRAPTDASRGLWAARASLSDADDQALATAVRAAERIELRDGTWIAWYEAANESRHEREWTRALRQAHATGTEIRATGGAAAWLARGAIVPRAVLRKPAQDPHDTTLDLPVEGLGLFDAALVGVLTPDSPSADRVVERAVAFGYHDVLLLAGPAEFDWDPAAESARIRMPAAGQGHDSGTVIWIDLAAGTRSRSLVRGARASFPRDGDVFRARSRTLEDDPPFRGDAPPDDAPIADLTARLERRAGGGPVPSAGDPARVRNVRAARDEKTLRSSQGGLTGVAIDLELVHP